LPKRFLGGNSLESECGRRNFIHSMWKEGLILTFENGNLMNHGSQKIRRGVKPHKAKEFTQKPKAI
jgi:hypothetical protein